ncbi:D-alanyl-D-alanine carboxypeptidase family protein [Risungbinella massiliensis]|uniref:D-alanyl-D-alanine carboxypeptidase family protein n=1 Tax=Risungbinella massiliensis TaxID=1329796 RepID=UPI0005CB8643|nr:D-alanyl-D-alanine carboxypeptidase family protein [Risungbinella massiliensis]
MILFVNSLPVQATPIEDSAMSSVLMDVQTGRVLYGKNEEKEMKIASLTKIMTAIVAIEKGDLRQIVKISPNAVGVEGSSIYLKQGDQVSLETLLYGLMLRSGNDAATAIAEFIGGSVEGFVLLMNEKAQILGLEHTNFENPSGLDSPKHYSSAKDLATLTRYALQNQIFRQIVSTEVKDVSFPGEEWKRRFYNKNKMLKLYPYADGVKTGFTKQARRTLVSSATKDGRQLVAVTLNDGDDWQDHINMFEYGFNQFEQETLLLKGQVVQKTEQKNRQGQSLYLSTSQEFHFPLTKEEKEMELMVEPVITMPLERIKGEKETVGVARIKLKDKVLGTVPLVGEYRKEKSIVSEWKKVLDYLVGQGKSS